MAGVQPFFCLKTRYTPYGEPKIERAQRFLGQAYPPPDKPLLWAHAVSLGELNTAYPVLQILLAQGYGLYVTYNTKTAHARALTLFANNACVAHGFLPFDRAKIVQNFLDNLPNLQGAIFFETELWANALYELARRKIPSVLLNARLSHKSYQGYARFGALHKSMMAHISIVAQDDDSAMRFRQLGACNIALAPSLKWASVQNTATLLIKPDAPIWIGASTHAGEEQICLQAHAIIRQSMPAARLIIVPRHPERFENVYAICSQAFATHRRSLGQDLSTPVFLGDSMGELMGLYSLCDVAFVGGSLVPVGGHTPVEPAFFGVPVLMGKHHASCAQIVHELQDFGALHVIDNADELAQMVVQGFAYQNRKALIDFVKSKQHSAQIQADLALQIIGNC